MFIKDSDTKNTLLLNNLLRKEFSTIRFKFWLDYFPCNVAVWRFIEIKRANVLGELNSGFEKQQYFCGKGSKWFTGILLQDSDYLDILDSIVTDIITVIKPKEMFRDFLYEDEVPELNQEKIATLAQYVLNKVDTASDIE